METSFKIPKKNGAGKKRSAEDTALDDEATSTFSSAGDIGAGKGKAKKAKKTSGSTRSSKSAKNNKTAAGPSAEEVSKLLHWLSRSDLENLIASSVTTKSILSESDLKNALPAEAKWRFSSASSPGILKKTKANGPVKAGRERVNTGLFDGLDTVIMGNILHGLNVKERYLCCTSVAKSWRGIKTKIPGLFVDLSDDSFQRIELVSGYSGEYSSTKEMTANQVLALMEWVPDLSAVTGLRISTRDSCNPNTCKSILKKLVAAKKKAKKSMDLTKLVLVGPKIYGSVIAEAIKGGIGPTLTSLTIRDVKTTKQTKLGEGCISDLFRTCCSLQKLVMPQSLAVENTTLRAHLAALSAARSGATTLLRVLDLNDGTTWGADRMRFSEMAAIGKYAPELEVLKLVIATGVPSQAANESIPTPATFLSEPMTELPRLKEFGIDGLVKRHVWQAAPRYATTSTTNRIISWLLAGMPKVESFEFGHGETYMSQKEQKIYQAPTLPGIGGGDGPMALLWPPTLKKLRLDTLILEKDAFKSVHLPALEILQLRGAGPHMMDIIDGMKKTHNHLQIGVHKNTGGTGQTDYHKRNNYLHGVCLTNLELPLQPDPKRPRMIYKPFDDESGEESE